MSFGTSSTAWWLVLTIEVVDFMDKWSYFLKLSGECVTNRGLAVHRESLVDLVRAGVSDLYCPKEICERAACVWLWKQGCGYLETTQSVTFESDLKSL